jgi:hypothetical protein
MTDPTRGPETPIPVGDELVQRRAELNPEEREAGSEDPVSQARAILEDSEARVADPDAAPGTFVERRTSDETVAPIEEP